MASATCGPNTTQTTAFNSYLAQCRNPSDTSRATNFFSSAKDTYKATFESLNAQYTDLITTGDSMNTLAGLAGATTTSANTRINDLTKRKDKLLEEKAHYERIANSADKSFLEDIMHGTPKKELLPSLQDVALFIFWFGWLFMTIAIVSVRWFSPGGSWRAGVFTLILMALVTVTVMALLKLVA